MPLRTRQQILTARKNGDISTEQATALLNALSTLQRDTANAELTQTEVTNVLSGGSIDRRNILQRALSPFNPFREESNIDTGIPIPFTDESISVNAPLGILGATLATAGLSAPGAGFGLGGRGVLGAIPRIGTRVAGEGAKRTAFQLASQGAVGAATRGGAVAGAGLLGAGLASEVQQRPPGPTVPTGGAGQTVSDAATAGADLGGGPTPQLPDPDDPNAPFIDTPVTNPDGSPTGQTIVTQNGVPVNPSFLNDPEKAQAQANFLGTREGQEFLATKEKEKSDLRFQRDQQVAAFERQREESIRQGNFAEQRGINERQREFLAAESQRQRDASFVQALLPILASPGSRFRFAANVSRLGGNQAQFTPTEAFGRLFQFSGLESGSAVPLTGQQDFSIIPNVQQFADFSSRDREELEAIVGESSGQSLFGVGRQSQRLAPPR